MVTPGDQLHPNLFDLAPQDKAREAQRLAGEMRWTFINEPSWPVFFMGNQQQVEALLDLIWQNTPHDRLGIFLRGVSLQVDKELATLLRENNNIVPVEGGKGKETTLIFIDRAYEKDDSKIICKFGHSANGTSLVKKHPAPGKTAIDIPIYIGEKVQNDPKAQQQRTREIEIESALKLYRLTENETFKDVLEFNF